MSTFLIFFTWMTANWTQISAMAVFVLPNIVVGLSEHPLYGEGRLHYVLRVLGRVAFVTFRNTLGTFKVPMGEQPPPAYLLQEHKGIVRKDPPVELS